jgi:F-type H+-transporting ATPase subunit beta
MSVSSQSTAKEAPTGAAHAPSRNLGRVAQVVGPVVDVAFDQNLPSLYNALRIKFSLGSQEMVLLCEVHQHLGNNMVRSIALAPTDGLKRGVQVEDTGEPIKVPVGRGALGRLMDVMGVPIDTHGPVKSTGDPTQDL